MLTLFEWELFCWGLGQPHFQTVQDDLLVVAVVLAAGAVAVVAAAQTDVSTPAVVSGN